MMSLVEWDIIDLVIYVKNRIVRISLVERDMVDVVIYDRNNIVHFLVAKSNSIRGFVRPWVRGSVRGWVRNPFLENCQFE